MKKLKIAIVLLCLALSGCVKSDKRDVPVSNTTVSTVVSDAAQEVAGSLYGLDKYKSYSTEGWYSYYVENEVHYMQTIVGAPSEAGKASADNRADIVKEKFSVDKPKVDALYTQKRKDGENINKKVKDSINNLIDDAILKFKTEQKELRSATFLKWCLGLAFILVISGVAATYLAIKMGRKPILGTICLISAGVIAFLPKLADVEWFIPSLAGIIIFIVLTYVVELLFNKKKLDKPKNTSIPEEKPEVSVTETPTQP